jgi:hypothetical protein
VLENFKLLPVAKDGPMARMGRGLLKHTRRALFRLTKTALDRKSLNESSSAPY